MKKRRLKKSVKRLITIVILICTIVWGYNVLNNKPQSVLEPQPENEPEVKQPEQVVFLNKVINEDRITPSQLKIITDFLDVYYRSAKELKEYDMTKFFDDDEEALINKAAVSLLIDIRKSKPNDLRMKEAKYDIIVNEVSEEDDEVKIQVLETSYIKFNFMDDIETKEYNLKNNFTLVKVNGKYKIKHYDKVKDFFIMITDRYDNGGQEELDEIKEYYLSLIDTKNNKERINYQKYLANPKYSGVKCDHKYDRDKASSYASKWVNKRNPEWSSLDSNCQNFASQVIYAGGIAMDYTGSADDQLQWKWYSATYNESQQEKGYVYTWTYVPYFYTYAKDNTGAGLCAEVDVNMYYAEPGDVIHVGTSGPTRHAMVVVDNYKKDGKVVDILVNSNTIDLENYPVSAYVYPYASLIKINGWND